MGKKYIGYAGTYTRQSSKGIYRFVLDTEKGKIETPEVAAEVGSPTYLSISEDGSKLYAVAQEGEMGGVHAYGIEAETGGLQMINGQLTDGAPPCHVQVNGDVLLTANYHKGKVEMLHVQETGSVEPGASAYHQGSGPHERQDKPHTHFAGYTPDGSYIVACDLGTDEVITYRVENEQLERLHTLQVKPGSGPRHIAFHPDGKTAYLLNELSSEVIVLAYRDRDGKFTEKQTISALPSDFTETNDASAIHISSDGKFVYTGNRGHNSIALFQVEETSKELAFIEHTSTGGDWPRDFVLDPSERFIVVSNQHTGNLVLFSRDPETGKLTETGSAVDVPEVVCVKFLG